MDQKNLVFRPHVLSVLVGTTVDFLNSDAVLHNVFSPDACADKFNLGTWPKGQTRATSSRRNAWPTLLCKVHPEMEAYRGGRSRRPYFAVTKADGSYRIADVPDGTYTVKVWHPKLKATAEIRHGGGSDRSRVRDLEVTGSWPSSTASGSSATSPASGRARSTPRRASTSRSSRRGGTAKPMRSPGGRIRWPRSAGASAPPRARRFAGAVRSTRRSPSGP